jgi:hypothetical protein
LHGIGQQKGTHGWHINDPRQAPAERKITIQHERCLLVQPVELLPQIERGTPFKA